MIDKGFKISLAAATAALFLHSPLQASEQLAATTAPAQKARLVDLWRPGDNGKRMNIRGRVTSVDGTPVANVAIEIRQPDGDGDWTEQYRTTLTTDAQGRYQFGSVVPVARYCGAPAVNVTVYQDGWEYYDANLVFDAEHDMSSYEDEGTPVFLEESTVKGETILFGRHDIVLSPE